ncbi:hypothetical protein [Flagellimonas oceanensis]|uniref:hypothetical protein n=1 Tax=Flagellimonas oceanensis TaxID=2499163 RepID=UPI0013DF98CE|nr:hypothetical protein [Allomuricauda oceanensis]
MNKIYVALFGLIFMTTLVVNVRGTISSYTEFYHTEDAEKRKQENILYRSLGFVENKAVSTFLSYTGMDTGFGFFAPNVASEYLTEFTLFSTDSTLIETTYFPNMHQKESVSRIRTAYSMFEKYMESDPDSLEIKRCDIFLKGLASKVLLDNEQAEFVNAKVQLYHYPTLEQLKSNKTMAPIYVFLKSKNYTRDELWENYK